MQQVGQSWLVYRLTGSTALMGTVAFLSQIPVLVLAPLGGALADRFDRRHILLVTQSLQFAAALVLAILALTGTATVPALMVIVSVSGLVSAFDVPARQSIVPRLVAREELPNAVVLTSSLYNFASFAGPAVAGVIIAWVGEGWCFAFNAASFIPVLGVLATLPLPRIAQAGRVSVLGNTWAGLIYIWQTRSIRRLLGMIGLMSFASTPYFVLMPVFANRILGGGPSMYGFLMACTGAGSMVACVVLAGRRKFEGIGLVIALAAFGFGAAILVFSFSTLLWLSIIALFAAGYGWTTALTGSNAVVQMQVEEEYRGRVMAGNSMMAVGMMPVASLVSGWTAAWVGVEWAIALSGVVSVLAAAAFMRSGRAAEGAIPPSVAPSHSP